VLAITEKGRQTLAKALPLWEEAQASVVRALGAENFLLLLAKLETVWRAGGGDLLFFSAYRCIHTILPRSNRMGREIEYKWLVVIVVVSN